MGSAQLVSSSEGCGSPEEPGAGRAGVLNHVEQSWGGGVKLQPWRNWAGVLAL